jgi:hypothetical protein
MSRSVGPVFLKHASIRAPYLAWWAFIFGHSLFGWVLFARLLDLVVDEVISAALEAPFPFTFHSRVSPVAHISAAPYESGCRFRALWRDGQFVGPE